MKLPVYNQKGKEVKEVEMAKDIFVEKVNDKVLAQYTFVYLSNQRQGNANTKTKAEVSGGGKKPWKQKGTGNARVGTNRSPLWRGGGITHGPTNDVNWKKKLTKSFKRSAFRNALTKLNQGSILKFVDEIKVDDKKGLTKQAMDIVKAFGSPKKLTIVTSEKNEELLKAFSNLQNYRVELITEVSVYDLLTGGNIIIEEKALDFLNQRARK